MRDVVDRLVEVRAVARFLHSAQSRPAALIVEGEAGIGKSTVWRGAVEEARGRGFRVLSARAVHGEAQLAYGTLAGVLADLDGPVVDLLPHVQRVAFDRVLRRRPEAGPATDERIVAVTLTGSEGAGMKVAEAAGRALKKVVLELGGSDPFIVMPSADLHKAAETAVKARIQNTGQSCICAKRMIVHADIYDRFMDRFCAGMKAVKAGDPMADDTDMGPLSSQEQRQTVVDQLGAITRAGARLLFGGEPLPDRGAFMSAGVLVDVPQDDPVAHEELFGPVAMVFKARDIDDAIRIANDVPFGLGSSVWTTDAAEQARFVRDIEAGMTAINQMLASSPEAPFGGIKRSGHGRELGPYGLHEFMNLKTVIA